MRSFGMLDGPLFGGRTLARTMRVPLGRVNECFFIAYSLMRRRTKSWIIRTSTLLTVAVTIFANVRLARTIKTERGRTVVRALVTAMLHGMKQLKSGEYDLR